MDSKLVRIAVLIVCSFIVITLIASSIFFWNEKEKGKISSQLTWTMIIVNLIVVVPLFILIGFSAYELAKGTAVGGFISGASAKSVAFVPAAVQPTTRYSQPVYDPVLTNRPPQGSQSANRPSQGRQQPVNRKASGPKVARPGS